MSVKRRVVLLLLASSLLFIGAWLLTVQPHTSSKAQDDPPPPPRVVSTIPIAGEELPLDSTVQFQFDRPMNMDADLTVDPALDGAVWSWENDNSTLVFTPPTEGYSPNTEYIFKIMAEDTNGIAMQEPFTLRIYSIGFLEVMQAIPEHGSERIGTDATITVVFNRPVVPLVNISDQADLPNPLEIEPPVTGEGEWVNTSIFVFRPETGLTGGIPYAVTVPAELTSADGAILQEDYSFTFTTIAPTFREVWITNEVTVRRSRDEIEQVEDQSYFDAPLDPIIEMVFTQPMDPATQEGIYLEGPNGERPELSYDWSEDLYAVTFTPVDLLELNTEYDIVGDDTVLRSTAGAVLPNPYRRALLTVPYPTIYSTSPRDGDSRSQPSGGFTIYFNAPIDEESLEDKITIVPTPDRETDTFYAANATYRVYFDTVPSADYTITIAPGIQDVYGNEITTETVVQYTTRAYTPLLQLNIPTVTGLYNAYDRATRVYITHRNINSIELQLYNIDVATLADIVSYNRTNYRPDITDRLRVWQVPASAAENTTRDKMVLISDQEPDIGVEDFFCRGAPARRLMQGIETRVNPIDPRPLPAYTEAGFDNETVTQFDSGTTLWVLNGPTCLNGYLWWEVQDVEQDITAWVPEGTTDSYFLEPLSDRAMLENGHYESLSPGAYYLMVTSPETRDYEWGPSVHTMIVANVNVTLKYGPHEALAWVTDMATSQPVPNVRVDFYTSDFSRFASILTDEDGIATTPIFGLSATSSIFASVQDDEHFGFTASRFEYGIRPSQFGLPTDYRPPTTSAYIYTDRPIYRPDQTVYFRGILRDRDDVQYTPMQALETVDVEIYDSRYQIVYETSANLTSFGTFFGEFVLDAEASLGNYRIRVNEPDNEDGWSYSNTFTVAEYRAPEFQVQATPAVDEVVQGDTVQVEIEGSYFFGGGVTNAQVRWTVLAQNYFFRYDGPGRWQFVDFDYDTGESGDYVIANGRWMEAIAEGEATTDEKGRFIIEVPAELGDHTGSQLYTIEAVITDESNQEVAGRTSVVVHQGYVYVGLAPERYISEAGRTATVNVLSTDWDSNDVPDQEIDYRVVERRWYSVQETDSDGRTAWTWDVEEIEIDSGTVTTNAEGRGTIEFVPPKGGTYKVYATTVDSAGNTVNSSTFMWVSGSQYVAWRQQNDNRIDLIADSDSYHVGDTAEILIPSPFQGETTALITVERDRFLHTEIVYMETNSHVFELPIEDIYAPNIYVSVVLLKGMDETSPYPQFRVGMIQLDVDTERLVMNIDVTPELPEDVTLAGPGDEVTLHIRTTDWDGDAVSAEVGIGMTDLAVLSLVPPNAPTLLEHFYSQRGLSVRTSTSMTISVDDYIEYVTTGRKGGGGGGGDMGIVEIRQDFVDTPLWEPTLVTDEDGEATVTVTLPDNLTTWRADARAITTGFDGPMLVGQSTADLISTKPLLIRPVTPRFMVVQDRLNLGAVVNNNTDEDQEVQIFIQGTGFQVMDDAPLTQTATIPANSRLRVDWPIMVLDVPNIDVSFGVINADGSLSDGSKPPLGLGDDRLLPVYRYVVAETVGTAGSLEGMEEQSNTETIILPEHLDPEQGHLDIQIDRSLAGPMLDGLDYLRNYPHQCIEQTISRFLPNAMTIRALRALDQSNPELEAELETQVNFGLQRLYAQQKSDGGWGWFPSDRSNPLTTAYALIGLAEARNSDFTVDTEVISDAQKYLQDYLEAQESIDLDRRGTSQLNRRIFVLYALTRSGKTDPARLSVMYDLRHRLNLDAKAYLAMSMMAANANDGRLATLMSDFASAAVLSATGTHWDDRPDYYNWTTNTRTTALVLMAMAHYDASNELLPGAVRWLMVARTADYWETTQETAWAVMSLTDWMTLTGELNADYDFRVILNSELLAEDTAIPDNVKESLELQVAVADLLTEEANRLVINKSAGNGNLYYTAHLTTFVEVPSVEPASRGIIIERRYHLATDADQQPITSARVGDEVIVTLNIVVPRALHYVVIEDSIPAGAEAVNQRLLTTSIVGQQPRLDRSDPLGRGWGWWWFSRTEFRDEKIVMYATYLPPGTYTYTYRLRLGLPGEYNVIPTIGQEFYFPEVYGRSAGMLFTIEPETDVTE